MSMSAHRRRRSAFTLVELLMVITIIGILVGLAGFAGYRAMITAGDSAVLLDIQAIGSGLQAYKADHQQYPPDFSDLNYSNRQTRFNNHRSLAWPRCGIAYSTLKTYILNNTSKAYGYNYMSGGQMSPLNLDTLDPAEALVFWLGGFPTPYGSNGVPMGTKKLFGFHTDVTNPFRLDIGTGTNALYRTTSLFDFDETRLVDNDNDGWYEYIPRGAGASSNGMVPPFVYFDAGGYAQLWANKSTTPPFTGYPSQTRQNDPNTSQMTSLGNNWGLAVPYAQALNNASGTPFVQWQNPQTFQIVAAGGDAMYGNPSNAASVRIPCFPSGFTYQTPGLNQGFFDPQEMDNLTNFATANLDAASTGQQGIAPAGSGSSSSGSGS